PRNDTIIKPHDYFVICRTDSRIALNNSGGDEVRLFQPGQDSPSQVIAYEKAPEGQSYNIINATSTRPTWGWSENITPGELNNVAVVNSLPEVDFSVTGEMRAGQILFFDSSDTVDVDGDELFYLWDFDGRASSTEANPIYIFLEPGIFAVTLQVSDGENVIKKIKTLNISSVETRLTAFAENNSARPVIINEFLPNPEGLDTEGEWIELKNKSAQPVDLTGWQLDDQAGGSQPFIISNITISPGGFYVFDRADTKLALNNSTDNVRLINNFGDIIDDIPYTNVKENVSFARLTNDDWLWTAELTPGEENILSNTTEPAVGGVKISAARTYWPVAATTLNRIREYEKGDLVKVSGVVVAEPGTFGVQYFYIMSSEDEAASASLHGGVNDAVQGVQVYNYNKYFPSLKIGDVVEVSGEISESYGELRLKTKTAEDIQKIATSTLPEPVVIESDKLGEEYEGRLVKISGEVVEKSGSTIYLDDGLGEVEIYIKRGAGINKSNIEAGDSLAVTGIVSQNNESYRIFPRSSDDIVANEISGGQVLGEISASDEWSLAQNNKRLKLIQYLLIISGGIIVILGFLVWKEKRKQ
ncbi:MAG: lamin tail domain-containing protein, partial [bacterium]|nr:lamin tail domain-containing protein [bacterium]